jgi:hypothetical protein
MGEIMADNTNPQNEEPAANAAKEAVELPANTVSPLVVAAPTSTSYFDLLKAVVADQNVKGDEKKQLLLQLKGMSPTSDRLTYRSAIWILGLIAVITIIAIWNIAKGSPDKIPEGLIAIASGAVGGLAGLLSPSRSSDTHST